MTDRRDFIRALGVAALGPVLHPLAPSPYPRAPLHKLDRIGLQLYTVRHQMEKDLEGTIARVATTGYREVEFAGYFGKSPRDVRALLDHHGLASPSSHVSLAPDQWRGAPPAPPPARPPPLLIAGVPGGRRAPPADHPRRGGTHTPTP